MSRESSLVKNTIILSMGTFIPKLVNFITLPILTAYLSKADYGTYDLVLVLESVFLPAATLQIQTAAFRYLITCRDNKGKTQSIISNIFAFLIPVSIIALVLLNFFLKKYTLQERTLVCLYFFVDIVYNTCLQIVRGTGNNFGYAISTIINSLGKVIFIVGGVFLCNGGLYAAVFALIMASAFSSIFLLLRCGILSCVHFSLIKKEEIITLIKYSWPMVPNSLAMWVMNLSDRLVITAFLGVEANAIYAVATKIPQLLSLAQSTFTMAWQENASLSVDDVDVSLYYTKMFQTILNVMVGFLAFLIGCTPILFYLLIRGDYQDAYMQMPLLFIGVLFSSLASYFGGIYVALMKTKSVGITTIVAAGINFLIDVFLVKKIGITAGSLSTAISFLVLLLFRMLDIRKFVEISYNYRALAIDAGLILVMCALFYQNTIWSNIINFVIGFCIFTVLNKDIIKLFCVKIRGKFKGK